MQTTREEFEATCSLFINSVENYFKHLTDINSELNVPYIKDSDGLVLKEVTGMIAVESSKDIKDISESLDELLKSIRLDNEREKKKAEKERKKKRKQKERQKKTN